MSAKISAIVMQPELFNENMILSRRTLALLVRFDDRLLGKEEFHLYLNLQHQSGQLTLTVLLKTGNGKRTGRISRISWECIWLTSTMAIPGNCIVGYVLWGNHMNGCSVQCKGSCNIQ